MSLQLAKDIIASLPSPVTGLSRGGASKDLTCRQLAAILAVEAGCRTAESLDEVVGRLPSTWQRTLSQLADRGLIELTSKGYCITKVGTAVLGSAPARKPTRPAPLSLVERHAVLDRDIAVVGPEPDDDTEEDDAEDSTAHAPVVVQAPAMGKIIPVRSQRSLSAAATQLRGSALLVADAELDVARAADRLRLYRTVDNAAALSAAYERLDECRDAAKSEKMQRLRKGQL